MDAKIPSWLGQGCDSSFIQLGIGSEHSMVAPPPRKSYNRCMLDAIQKRAFVYVEQLELVDPDLVDFCQRSWAGYGWHVVPLRLEHARCHPRFEAVSSNPQLVHRVEPEKQSRAWAQFHRWLAADYMAGAQGLDSFLLVAASTINYGWSTLDAEMTLRDAMKEHPIGCYVLSWSTRERRDWTYPPSPVACSRQTAAALFERLEDYNEDGRQVLIRCSRGALRYVNGETPLLNEVPELRALWHPKPVSTVYLDPSWNTSPLVTYLAQPSVKKRSALIAEVRPCV